MNICFIATSPYAIHSFLKNHITNLAVKNKVTVITNLKLSNFELNLLNVNIINLPISRKINVLSDFIFLIKIFIIFCINKFDVVHTITPKAGFIGILVSYICNIPYRFHTFTGQHWYNKSKFKKRIYIFFDKLIVFFSTTVFADGFYQKLELEKILLLKKNTIQILGPGSIAGVNINKFKPLLVNRINYKKLFANDENSFIFLYVGRLTKEKGVIDILLSLNKLKNINHKFEVWFVGPDEDKIEYTLSDYEIPLNVTIKFFGETYYPEYYMQSSDVFIFPSYREGFGSVLIEANACGLPVICYDIYGVRDSMLNGFNCILVEPGNLHEFSKQMIFLFNNHNIRSEIGCNGIEMSKIYDSTLVSEAWVNFYNSLN